MLLFAEPHAIISPAADKLINLLVLGGILFFVLKKTLTKFFSDRTDQIQAEIRKAREETRQAEEKLRSVQSRLANMDREVESIREEALREVEAERARIIASAEADAERMRIIARREIDAAAKTAQKEIRAYVAEQTIVLAKEILEREVGSEDQHRMVEQYALDLEEVKS